MRVPIILVASLALAACQTPGTVTETKYVEVRVPVSVPCVDQERKPDEVVSLNVKLSQEEWDKLSTDQRQALLMSQGFDRKKFGEELTVATAGCP